MNQPTKAIEPPRISPWSLLIPILLAAAFHFIHRELRTYHYRDIVHELSALPAHRVWLAAGLTAFNYLILSTYDRLALHYLKHPIALGRVLLTSFISYVFSYNIGLSVFGGAAIRYRLYSVWGLSASEIATVVGFCAMTLWVGFLALGGALLLIEPRVLNVLPAAAGRAIGFLLVGVVAAYVIWTARRKEPVHVWKWEFEPPSGTVASLQVVVSAVDWIVAGAVLYILLPAGYASSYPAFLLLFMAGQLSGMLSHVPGGLGVFEGVMIFFAPEGVSTAATVGSLIVYRAIYYLMPLLIAVLSLAIHEAFLRAEHLRRGARFLNRMAWGFLPQLFSATTFLAGMILLFSGATPAAAGRLSLLKGILPLPVIELSHFAASIAGTVLLFLAWGLLHRLDAAWVLTSVLLAAGAVASILKGADYEEAIVLTLVLMALLPCRPHFYRKTSLVHERLTLPWAAAIFVAVACATWLGFFSFKHVEYSNELWWRFGVHGEAPRFLRATVGTTATALAIAVRWLMRPPRPRTAVTDEGSLNEAAPIVETSRRTSAHLALLGDKRFLFSESRRAFVMYNVVGRSWVAMGDPVGPPSESAELIWRFREMCDQNNGWPVFYEVGRQNLYLYADLGLTFQKLGEEARVRLSDFTLEGGAGKKDRYVVNRTEKEGFSFRVASADEMPALLPRLKVISEGWLEEKKTREKGFSLGYFDEAYLSRFPTALVEREGEIVAFSNLWLGADKEEASVDLMRYRPGTPSGLMDYLFIRLFTWAKSEGYHWFNLGVAPLSGLPDRALAPLGNRLGAFLYRNGENFYNFQGLRQYKEKFHPTWEPVYLASPGGLALPRTLANVATLISGGLRGLVGK